MANGVDPDQTAPWEQSDQGLHHLLKLICHNSIFMVKGIFYRIFSGMANSAASVDGCLQDKYM